MSLRDNDVIGFIPTTNFDAAKKFFVNQLDFKLVQDDGFALVFRCGRNMLRVVKVEEFKPQQFTIVGWEVEDIESKVRELLERGVEFVRYPFFEQDELGIWSPPGGDKVAWFKDPDGNLLSVSQHMSQI